MKVFKGSSQILTLHCCLTPNSKNKWKNYGCVFYTVFYVVCSFLSGWSSWCFFVKSYSIDKANAFCALYQLVVVVGPICSFFISQFIKTDMEKNFADFQNFYDQNKDMDPMGLMKRAEKRGRQIVKNFLSFVVVSVSINFVTGFGSLSYHRNKDGNFSNYGEVHRPYRYVLPWDQSTLNGWILEMIFSLFLPIHYFIISPGFVTLLVTICEYHRSFCEIIKCQSTKIIDVVRCGTYRMNDLRKMFHKTVAFHIEAKQLFLKSANIYCFFIAGELCHFMLLTTFVVFHIDHAIRHLNLHFPLMAMGMAYGVMILYLYCDYGQKATDSYAAIADHLFQSDWLNVPNGLRRMYVLMIAHAQKELHYHGYGMVELNRETFLRMTKTIVGYVLMFKTFAEQGS